MYGGARSPAAPPPVSDATPTAPPDSSRHGKYSDIAQLALQCCALEFLDPDIVTKLDGTTNMTRSERWNRFRLDESWWSPMLEHYRRESLTAAPEQATISISENSIINSSLAFGSAPLPRPELLPPRVSLSPGTHKYVLVRATHPSTPNRIEWFVKSAAPNECGGPYHGTF